MKYFAIFILLTLSASPVFAETYYTQKDVLDAKTHAFAMYNVSKKDEALGILEKIPNKFLSEDICLVRANIYEDKGDFKNAYNNLNQALQLNPKSYKAYYNLGLLAYKKGNMPLAIDNFKKSIKNNSEFAYSYHNLALCYIKTGEYNKAKKELIKATSIEPDKDFYYNLAYVYKKLNNEKQAQKILESYNEMD